MGIFIILLFFVAAWFLLIVPRKRELRRHQLLMSQIAPGDEVVTSSGVYGTIRTIEGDVVQLEVAPGIELKLAKRAIATIAVPPQPVIDAGSVVDLTAGDLTAGDLTADDARDDLNDSPGGPDRPDIAGP
jgi:preprotein translocase subunit YajC